MDGIRLLPVEPAHLSRFVGFRFHRRILAQALVEGVPVRTRDCAFATYGTNVLWD